MRAVKPLLMLGFVNTRLITLSCCAVLLAAASACTINIVPPGSTPQPAPPTAPPPETALVPPAVIEQQAPATTTHDCEELQRAGMTFTQVVQHWYGLGAPADMDDDSDGIPCETVYGEKNSPATTTPRTATHDCATLQSQGMSFAEVIGYWNSVGSPGDMDDDSDGIPCETVYGER